MMRSLIYFFHFLCLTLHISFAVNQESSAIFDFFDPIHSRNALDLVEYHREAVMTPQSAQRGGITDMQVATENRHDPVQPISLLRSGPMASDAFKAASLSGYFFTTQAYPGSRDCSRFYIASYQKLNYCSPYGYGESMILTATANTSTITEFSDSSCKQQMNETTISYTTDCTYDTRQFVSPTSEFPFPTSSYIGNRLGFYL